MTNTNTPPSQAAIAKALGIAKSRVTALKAQGMPVDTIAAALAWRTANLHPGRIKAPVAAPVGSTVKAIDRGSDETFLEARSRRERSEADKSEIELTQLQSVLINRAGIEMALETAWRHVRDSIMTVPDKLPIDTAHRLMFQNALRDTLSDALKMLPRTTASEPVQGTGGKKLTTSQLETGCLGSLYRKGTKRPKTHCTHGKDAAQSSSINRVSKFFSTSNSCANRYCEESARQRIRRLHDFQRVSVRAK